jgi:hypothetical protein
MTSDHQTMVTGGPLGKRNLLVWDLRNLVEPTVSIEWSGDKTNPMIHTVKIVDDKIILVGATDDECPAKCFSLQSGELWANFPELSKSAMSVDARGKKVAITDSTGKCATYQMKFAK